MALAAQLSTKSNTKSFTVLFEGGLDVETKYLEMPPGRVRASVNFQPGLNGGYERIKGFERFDGRPEPHLQTYYIIRAIDLSTLVVGDIVTGLTSGASGEIISLSDQGVDLGFPLFVDPNDVVLTKVTGAPFTEGEDLQVLAVTQTTVDVDQGELSAALSLDSYFRKLAADVYRDDIVEVPGSGKISGTWTHLQFDYVWRDNAGATEGIMHVASAAGWVPVVIDTEYVFFTAGDDAILGSAPQVGDTLTGDTSGATGTIVAVVKQLGAFGDSDATGYFVMDTLAGSPFTSGEDLSITASVVAVADGNSIVTSFDPGGDYQVLSHNFYALDDSYYMYFVNGANFGGFEYHPLTETLIPILPPVPVSNGNKPFLIIAHKQHLFFMYPEGSLQNSIPGTPLIWDGALGSAEFGLGAEGTGLEIDAGEVLIAYTSRNTWGLFGNNVDDWTLTLISAETGGKLFTTQQMKMLLALDDRGFVTLPRSNAFGNFQHGTISRLVQGVLPALKGITTKSSFVRELNQYRLFFNTGLFVIIYLPESTELAAGSDPTGVAQFMFGDYGKVVTTMSNAEDELGNEKILFGTSDDGFVYRSEVGPNFDGLEIESFLEFPNNFSNTPRLRKRYRRAHFQLDTDGPVLIQVNSEVNFGDLTTTQPRFGTFFAAGAEGGFWDLDDWNEIFWDAVFEHEVRLSLAGTGVNISFILYHNSAINEPFTVHSVMIDYDPRRSDR